VISVNDGPQNTSVQTVNGDAAKAESHARNMVSPERAWCHDQTLRHSGAESAKISGDIPHHTPHHVAIIMDGNGRWAKARGLPRIVGHRSGANAVRKIVSAAPRLGVKYLTLFAFSTENWRRPTTEVTGLMSLFEEYLVREADQLVQNGVRVRFIGDNISLADSLCRKMAALEARTAHNSEFVLSVALNYGGRAEIVNAAKRLARDAAEGRIDLDAIGEAEISKRLWTAEIPDPDLLIRTSGEQRLSNFLLWQAAYAEFYFAPEPWPDFDETALEAAIKAFCTRERRFGDSAQ
jgi:undecaprenyl diphosphate synthase